MSATDETRCHWCDARIDEERGYTVIECHPEFDPYPSSTQKTYACQQCAKREIDRRVHW